MGILFIWLKEETTSKMKSAFVVCLAVFAAAEPEADAGILGVNTLKLGYTNLGLSNIASPIGYGSIGLSAISSPIVSSIAAPAILSGSSLWKRDAKAEPEADAGLLGYSNLGLSTIASPIGYSNIGLSGIAQPISSPIVSSIAAPALATSIASPIISSVAAPAILSRSSLWKRDAEAEPKADAGLLRVNTLGLGYSNFGLSNIASPIGYSNIGLSTIAQPIATSPIVSSIAAPALATSYASPIVSNIAAPALAKSIASPIVSSIAAPAILSRSSLWKRDAEAEPEADPSLLGVNTL